MLEQDQLPKGSQDFENPVQTLGDGHRVTQTEPLVDVDEQGGHGTSGNKKHSRSRDKRKRTDDNEKQAAKRTKMVWVADENSKYNPIPGANNREDYPLQFEFQQFWPLEADHETDSKPPLDRQTIVQQIKNIIVGYSANELFPLLQEAAKIVLQKFSKDDRLLEARANQFYYLHGQEPLRSKKRNTKENPPNNRVESSDRNEKAKDVRAKHWS